MTLDNFKSKSPVVINKIKIVQLVLTVVEKWAICLNLILHS